MARLPSLTCLLLSLTAALACQSLPAHAQTSPAQPVAEPRGQHDFDFEIGSWQTRLKRLVKPLSGSKTWVEYTGTSTVRTVWGGQANLVELDVEGPAGRIEGLSLRLFNPETGQWTLNFASRAEGVLTEPVFGSFKDGVGEFYGQELFNGRAILVRFVISEITRESCRFEQAFSEDGGKSWEVNWIAVDTRLP